MTAIYDLLFEFYFQELIDQIFPITDEEDFLSNASDQLLKGEDYRIWRLQKRSFLRLVISFSTRFIYIYIYIYINRCIELKEDFFQREIHSADGHSMQKGLYHTVQANAIIHNILILQANKHNILLPNILCDCMKILQLFPSFPLHCHW